MNRRTFLNASVAAGTALKVRASASSPPSRRPPIDFRYAPLQSQATICFPDDPHKSLVGEQGDLRLGYDRRKKINYFPFVVEFSLRGMNQDHVAWQKLEAPGVPVIYTRIERPAAWVELTAFATNRTDEGRVDNVILEAHTKSPSGVLASPVVRLRTRQTMVVKNEAERSEVSVAEAAAPFFLADCPLGAGGLGDGFTYTGPATRVFPDVAQRHFFRFPQENQSSGQLAAGLRSPLELLSETRAYWQQWSPFQNGVTWQLPERYQNFLVACARNLLQARERVDGRLTFQVGPTTYRGLWVVDGNFILEAARYLGYDGEVQQGLETTWSMQRADGSVVAAVETAHWKDTGIAMFSLVRQAELRQDWTYFRQMQPQVLRGVGFLDRLRDEARREGSANGRYGLLAKGFGDGGIGGGLREEFTNTLWALAGLRAVRDSAATHGISGYEPCAQLFTELSRSFFAAARQEMRRHPRGFGFLPMLMKDDPEWGNADSLKRPQFQTGQWALAQSIYPGLVFEPADPVVQGYISLMKACTSEDVPAETGWLPHDGLWNYDAAFAAHACLWAGARDYALSVFRGFLNHATPLYCWREEQPLQTALTGSYVGDMPHNWASAECILFLRHMLVLEDGATLRLLAGIDEQELSTREPFVVLNTPTRFGRVNLRLEPQPGKAWKARFERAQGPVPAAIILPQFLGGLPLQGVKGAAANKDGNTVHVDPSSAGWEAVWKGKD